MTRQPIFLQAKFPTSQNALDDLCNRWEKYGQLVAEFSNQEVKKIWIYGLESDIVDSLTKSNHLEFLGTCQKRFSLFLPPAPIIEIIERNQTLKVTLVCGDYFKALISALIIRCRYPGRVKVQIQYHGDFFKFRRRPSLRLYIQNFLGRLAVHFADSIRVVSASQERAIRQIIAKREIHVVCCPIPIDASRISPRTRIPQKHQVVFVGRLHEERGIKMFAEIAEKLVLGNEFVNIMIAGSGPEETWLKNVICRKDLSNKIEFCGELTSTELQQLYGNSRVLISTAPHESYGLSIREAALSGIYVAARDNSGVREAILDFPDLIANFKSSDEAVKLVGEMLERALPHSLETYIQHQIDKDRNSCHSLAQTWLSD